MLFRSTIVVALVLGLAQVPAFAAAATPSAPFKPQLSVGGSTSLTDIVVTWLAPLRNGGSVTDYTIQYSSNTGTTWTTFTHPVSTATTVTLTGLAAGNTYSVRVRAESPAGASAWAIASSKAERFESVAGGQEFSCAVLVDATVQCWGRNASGQLGDGTLLTRAYVGYVSGITSAQSVVAGFAHACALLTNGDVYCWGSNLSGQLGNATTTDSSVPVKVLGLPTRAIALAAGSAHTCAVTADNKLYCWGANGSGQLGLGDTVLRNQAGLAAVGVTGVGEVAAGAAHTCVASTAGAVSCWGANAVGQLGRGNTTSSLAPVATGLTTAAHISARNNNTCAALASGSVQCWGENKIGRAHV